jgi:uncharacterized protein (TIGR02996 family)
MTTADPPTALLDAIRTDPHDGEQWLALADWLFVHARDDEAVAVRGLWPTLRENLAVASLEDTLADVAKNAAVLAAIARKMPTRADDETRPV